MSDPSITTLSPAPSPVSVSVSVSGSGVRDAGFWEPRRALTLDAARRHSEFIKFVRLVLMICAAILFAILAWYFISAPKTITPTANVDETVKMVNPVYKGRTADGLPYRITANDAVRFIQTPDEVKLSEPILNFLRVEGAKESTVHAKSGSYDSKYQILNLEYDVKLNTDDGYLCDTSQSLIFVKDKRIAGDEPIQCDGSFGQVSGNAYEINNNYSQFVFKDAMTARLIPDQTDEALRGVSGYKKTGKKSSTMVGFGTDRPVNITADKAVYTAKNIVLTKAVKVVQDDANITSNTMNLIRERIGTKEDGTTRYGNVHKIIAKGDFKYTNPQSSVSGKQGVYERDENRIIVTGDVKYSKSSGETIKTCRLIYDLLKNTAKFDGSCKTKDGKKGRVVITTGG